MVIANPMHQPGLYEYNGKLYTLKQLAAISSLDVKTLRGRIKQYGMTVKKAVEMHKINPYEKKKYNYHGEMLTFDDAESRFKIKRGTLQKRMYKHNLSFEQAVDIDYHRIRSK